MIHLFIFICILPGRGGAEFEIKFLPPETKRSCSFGIVRILALSDSIFKIKRPGFMRNFTLSLFLLIAGTISKAQVSVKGKIKDKLTGDGLIGVAVIADSKTGGVSDLNGNYSLTLPEGKHSLEFRLLGYTTFSRQIDGKAGDSLVVDVVLETSARALDMVVVSAGKFEQKLGDVTVSMEVITPQLVENKNTTSLENIIDQVPGVNVTDGQANIRGGSGYSYGGGSRVLLLVDDMPLLSADAGDIKWNFLPIENLQQIEVIKGASSALFGSSALDGVINIRTAYPTSTPQSSIVMYSGIYDNPERPELVWWKNNQNPMFRGTYFFHSRQIKNWDLTIGGNLFDNDGYQQDGVEKRYRFNVNTRYRFKRVVGLSAGVNFNYMDVSGGNFLLWADGNAGALRPLGGSSQHYDNVRFNIDPYITYFTKKGGKHSLRTRYFYTLNTNDTQQKSFGGLYYFEYQYQKHFENGLTVTTGLTASFSQITSQLYGTHYSSNKSAYMQFDKKFFKRLTASLGLRAESYKLDSAQTSFYLHNGKDTLAKMPFQPVMRLGLNYQIARATYIRASYGQGYRFPSVAEKYIRTSVSGLEIYPNTQLKPETGSSTELGIKQGFQLGGFKGFLDVAAFQMVYHNMMEFAFGQWGNPNTDPLFGLGFKSTNIGTTQISGIDVSLEGDGKIGKIGVRGMAGYTYMDPISLDFNYKRDSATNSSTQNILKYRYRHIAKADVELSYKKFAVGVSMRYNSFMENIDHFFVDPLFAHILPGIAEYRQRFHNGDIVFDNRISYQLNKKAKISIITNNMFNRETTSRPADVLPPRNYALQISVKF
jgi:outer membrane cobalamin receptor